MFKNVFSILLFSLCITSNAENFKVGIARKVITPKEFPVWLSGYASRQKPATGVCNDLWAKSLVIQDSNGKNIIIITVDIMGLTHEISEVVSGRLIKKFGIDRSELLLNSAHIHSGPVLFPSYSELFFNVNDLQTVAKYGMKLADDLVDVADMAMKNLEPMVLSSGHGTATFGRNRRDPKITIRPVDNDVPVLRVSTPDGTLKAVLFGYACHNTTLPGDYYEINGDYAGYAQLDLEKNYPGITALFFQGCCGDIDPSPRGKLEYAEQNGKSLAMAVSDVLSGSMVKVRPPIRTDYSQIDLDFCPFDLEFYQNEMMNSDRFRQRRAKLMLEAYNKSWDVSRFPYPVQAIRFNTDLTIVAMSGEVVVDYSLKLKKDYPKENLFVAGYSNEVMCYIPSKRILEEGGYEGGGAMVYKGLPGPFADNVEDKVNSLLRKVMKNVGVKYSK